MTLALPLCQPPQPSLGSLSYHYIIGTRDWEIVGKSGSVSFRLHMVPYDSDRWNGFLSQLPPFSPQRGAGVLPPEERISLYASSGSAGIGELRRPIPCQSPSRDYSIGVSAKQVRCPVRKELNTLGQLTFCRYRGQIHLSGKALAFIGT